MSTEHDQGTAPPRPSADDFVRLEARVFEGERRLIPALLHFLARKQYAQSDPRRSAAKSALLWCLFPFNNAASAAGFVGLFLTIATVYLSYRSNTMVQQELTEIRHQNELAQAQFDFAQQQFARQRRTDAHRRQTELLVTLNARKECVATMLGADCPFEADDQARVYAIVELSSLQEALLDAATPARSAIASVDLRDVKFPNGAKFDRLELGGIDIGHASIAQATFTNVNLQGAKLPGAILEETRFENTNLSYADVRGVRFMSTVMQGVDMSSSSLTGSVFSIDIASGRLLVESPPSLNDVDFSHASLHGVDFAAAKLTNCKFDASDLTGAIFSDAQINEHIDSLSAAKICPNGEPAKGSCRGKTSPALWAAPDRDRIRRFLGHVEVELEVAGTSIVDPTSHHFLTMDVESPRAGSEEPLLLIVRQTSLNVDQLSAVRDIAFRHARELTHGTRIAERVTIRWEDGLVSARRAGDPGSFRSSGCIEPAEPEEEGYSCNFDRSDCTVKWPPGVRLTYYPPCRWNRQRAEERLRYVHDGDQWKIVILSLGSESLLAGLGFRAGDIVEGDYPREWPVLRHAHLWAVAADISSSELKIHRYYVTRKGRRTERIIRIVGRALGARDLNGANNAFRISPRPGIDPDDLALLTRSSVVEPQPGQ